MDRKAFLKRAAALGVAVYGLDGDAVVKVFEDNMTPQMEEVISMTTLSTVDEVLKNYYLPVVRDQLNQRSVLLG